MSYYERDLSRHSISLSCGVTLLDWTLPLGIGVGGSGLHERGISISFLCFWIALRWWPLAYPVPNRFDSEERWDCQFKPERDFGYMLEAADIEASILENGATKLRNAVDVLRALHEEGERAAQAAKDE